MGLEKYEMFLLENCALLMAWVGSVTSKGCKNGNEFFFAERTQERSCGKGAEF